MSNHFYRAEIVSIQDETEEAYTLFLKSPDAEAFDYLPGQYLTLRIQIDGKEYRRAFSLSSAPGVDALLAITIKRIPEGKVSHYLRDHLRPGDTLEVMRPMGHFTINPSPDKSRHYVLIGAGSGITPLMSMIKAVLRHEPLSVVSLWYGNRNRASVIFRDQLTALQERYPGRFYVHHTLSKPEPDWKGFRGRLDAEHIYDLIADLFMNDEHRKQYYICGPRGLMEDAEAALQKHAVFPTDIFREYFTAPVPTEEEVEDAYREEPAAAVREETFHHVHLLLDGTEYELNVSSSQSILDAALEAKIDAPYACQAGICTTCRARLREGEVHMDYDEGLSDIDREQGYILTCQSHPLADDVLVEFE
jgi:ring-1,2-phenylacetyl-CoA epoxidase subunit PaaE